MNPCTKKRKKRQCISLEKKIEILNQLKTGLKQTYVAKQYGLNESTIRTIKRKEDAIRKSVAVGSSDSAKCKIYTRKSLIESTESALIAWIRNKDASEVSLSSYDIMKEALRIFNDKKANSQNPSEAKFNASRGWFNNFKKRYNLNSRDTTFDSVFIDGEMSSQDCPTESESVVITNPCLPDVEFCVEENTLFKTEKNADLMEDRAVTTSSDLNKRRSIEMTADAIDEGLRLGIKLQMYFLQRDPDTKRALKFQKDLQKALSPYEDIFNEMCQDR